MKFLFTLLIISVLYGCVSGAPRLSTKQQELAKTIPVLKKGEVLNKEYAVIEKISAADCSGAPYGALVWGNSEKAIETLKKKAVSIEADGVIEVSCSVAPLVNNCWAAKKCSGIAVKFK